MKAYLARDEDRTLVLYLDNKPVKKVIIWDTISSESIYRVIAETDDRYAHIKWEDDEPTEVTLEIKL